MPVSSLAFLRSSRFEPASLRNAGSLGHLLMQNAEADSGRSRWRIAGAGRQVPRPQFPGSQDKIAHNAGVEGCSKAEPLHTGRLYFGPRQNTAHRANDEVDWLRRDRLHDRANRIDVSGVGRVEDI